MLTLVSFSGSWWVPVVRGTMAVVFAVLAFSLTVTTLAAVILAFGLYVLADRLFAIAAAIASRTRTGDWWILLLQGVLGVGVGVATLRYPNLRHAISFEWWLACAGIAGVAFGMVLLVRPVQGAVVALWVIASYSFAWGVMLLLGGVRTRTRTPLTRAA